MELETVMISEISWTNTVSSHLYVESKPNQTKENQVHRYIEQVGGYQRLGMEGGVGEMVEGGQKAQTSSYNINKSY